MLVLSVLLVIGAGCAGDSLPAPGVIIGCVPGEATAATLADVCADPASYESQRFTLSGDWQQGQGRCSQPVCSPGTCCGACETKYVLTCPDGSTTIALEPGPELSELPGFQGACGLPDGCPIYTRLGCAGAGGSDATDCSGDWACTPDAATICSATGVVRAHYGDRIELQVDAIALTVAPAVP